MVSLHGVDPLVRRQEGVLFLLLLTVASPKFPFSLARSFLRGLVEASGASPEKEKALILSSERGLEFPEKFALHAVLRLGSFLPRHCVRDFSFLRPLLLLGFVSLFSRRKPSFCFLTESHLFRGSPGKP